MKQQDENALPEYREWHQEHAGHEAGPNPRGIITTGDQQDEAGSPPMAESAMDIWREKFGGSK